jgi:long-chain acyl-CoA synthetase
VFAHLYELLQARAGAHPDAPAVGGQDGLVWRTLTGRQLLDLTDRLAAELSDLGVGEGDRVVLWAPNHWRTPIYLFAIWRLGAVAVPFDREMNPEGGARILAAVEPRAVLAGYGERPAWARDAEVTEWWEPGSRGGTPVTAPWIRPAEELAALMFTSGTTGTPKGCMISHANLCSQVDAIPERVPLDSSCRLASILPLSHLLELTGMLHTLASGAAVHYVPSRRAADVQRVLVEQRITHMVVVPQILLLLGRAQEEQLAQRLPPRVLRAMYALARRLPLPARRRVFWPLHQKLGGHLRLLLSGGAALPEETHRLWERFGVRVVQGYGTSECSPVVTLGSPDGRTPLGSVGRALRDVELRLGGDGELLVRGPNVMRGYWRDPERTAEVLKDGWYATGDLAEIDAQGYVKIVGRARDLIALPSGLKVWPEDVEDVLRQNPLVRDAAVVAVPTPGGGVRLHAYLLPAGPSSLQSPLPELVATSNARLAVHQRLASASWYPEPDFPRTSMLKVRRHLLPAPGDAAVDVDLTLSADDPVGLAVAGVARVATVRGEQTLGELGLDSLGLVELAAAVETKTGKAVADDDLSLTMTVDALRSLVAGAPDVEAANSRVEGSAPEKTTTDVPDWPYTWGRIFRVLDAPFRLLYRFAITKTVVLGAEHLVHLPPRVIFAGTHHGFPDMSLVRYALSRTPARRLANGLIVPIAAGGFGSGGLQLGRGLGLYPWYGILAFGLYPLRQQAEREVSLRGLARLAQPGNAVLIFPQGTHARPAEEIEDSPRVRFRPGVFHLARALGASVVPFGLAGTERLMPWDPTTFRGVKIAGVPVSIHRGPLAIAFGPPVDLEANETPQAFAARLQTICYALTRQAEAAIQPASIPGSPDTPDEPASASASRS